MNRLQQFIQTVNARTYGFLRDTDIPELIAIDRLCQVLVRCGGCRFTCAAQDVDHLEACITAGGDYVRDVSFPVGALERAASYVPEQFRSEHPTKIVELAPTPDDGYSSRFTTHFNAADCGGVFDGNQVWSDTELGGAPGF